MNELDKHIMQSIKPDTEQAELPRHIPMVEGEPEIDEPKPGTRWLYGSPSQATIDRGHKVNEMSKQLKHTTYDN